MALDTDRLPFTLHVPNQITHPPRASILFFSSYTNTNKQTKKYGQEESLTITASVMFSSVSISETLIG